MVTLYAEGSIGVTGGTRTPAYAVTSFKFTNNMTTGNAYGLHSSVGFGTAALTAMTRGYTWTNNVIADGWGTYPAITTFVTYTDYMAQLDASHYLVSTSRFKSMATDGTDIGWNRASEATPVPPPPPPPPPPAPVAAPVSITTTSLPGGRTGNLYATNVAASGGSGTFKWSVAAGALPSGVVLDANTGGITGKPTQAGTSAFTIRVADAADSTNTASASYSVAITAPVSIATASLPNALKGRLYTATLASTNGVGPIAWSVTVGRVPPGLALDPNTGVISGKTSGQGAWTFTVKATDANSSASRELTIQVDRK
jgi:hypothetical protein